MRLKPRLWYREAPIMLYGLAILLSGVFSTEPFIEGVPYSPQEARLHSICATAAGAMLTLATLLYTLTDTPPRRRAVHWVALALITGISLAVRDTASDRGHLAALAVDRGLRLAGVPGDGGKAVISWSAGPWNRAIPSPLTSFHNLIATGVGSRSTAQPCSVGETGDARLTGAEDEPPGARFGKFGSIQTAQDIPARREKPAIIRRQVC